MGKRKGFKKGTFTSVRELDGPAKEERSREVITQHISGQTYQPRAEHEPQTWQDYQAMELSKKTENWLLTKARKQVTNAYTVKEALRGCHYKSAFTLFKAAAEIHDSYEAMQEMITLLTNARNGSLDQEDVIGSGVILARLLNTYACCIGNLARICQSKPEDEKPRIKEAQEVMEAGVTELYRSLDEAKKVSILRHLSSDDKKILLPYFIEARKQLRGQASGDDDSLVRPRGPGKGPR
jgi:hypothetical protein